MNPHFEHEKLLISKRYFLIVFDKYAFPPFQLPSSQDRILISLLVENGIGVFLVEVFIFLGKSLLFVLAEHDNEQNFCRFSLVENSFSQLTQIFIT